MQKNIINILIIATSLVVAAIGYARFSSNANKEAKSETSTQTKGTEMATNQVAMDEIKIVGISVKTSPATAQQDLPALWGKFFSEGILAKIPNKISDEVLGVYIDYEGDHTKPYTCVIGCKVKSFDDIPDGLISKTIPAAKYSIFTATGKISEVLPKTWQDIWSTQLDRTFTGDFELYSANCNPDNTEIKIYIAVK